MQESPTPLALTTNTSTNSLLLLKYWPTIIVELFNIMHTPTPGDKNSRNGFKCKISTCTYNYSITEIYLEKIVSKRCKETSQSNNKTTNNCGDPC